MTINMLIQIDKLVQLLESPVFTCMCSRRSYDFIDLPSPENHHVVERSCQG